MSHPTQSRSFGRRFPKSVSWLGMDGKKLNLTQQKHAFTNQKKCATTQNKQKTKASRRRIRLFDVACD